MGEWNERIARWLNSNPSASARTGSRRDAAYAQRVARLSLEGGRARGRGSDVRGVRAAFGRVGRRERLGKPERGELGRSSRASFVAPGRGRAPPARERGWRVRGPRRFGEPVRGVSGRMMLRRLDFHLGVKRPRARREAFAERESIANERHKCSSRGRRRHPDRLDGVVARRSFAPRVGGGDLKTARNPTRTVPDRDRIALKATFGANGETLGEIGPQVSREEGGDENLEEPSLPKPISVRVLPPISVRVCESASDPGHAIAEVALDPPPHAPLCLPRAPRALAFPFVSPLPPPRDARVCMNRIELAEDSWSRRDASALFQA